MTPREFELWLATVEYKNWRFQLINNLGGYFTEQAVQVTVPTLDSRSPELNDVRVTHITPIMLEMFDSHLNIERFFFDHVIMQAERHESQEWFKVGGKAPLDPHNQPDRPKTDFIPVLEAQKVSKIGFNQEIQVW